MTVEAGMVVKSIGYRGVSIDPTLPFDNKTGTISNDDGRVRGMPGVYCSGWIGRGPVGVIADTLANALHVAKVIAKDFGQTAVTPEEAQERAKLRDNLLHKIETKGRKLNYLF